MRIAYNGKTDTGYIRLTDYEDGDVARWRLLADDEIGGMFTFDFDKAGRLLGIEIKLASWAVPPEFWEDAERV